VGGRGLSKDEDHYLYFIASFYRPKGRVPPDLENTSIEFELKEVYLTDKQIELLLIPGAVRLLEQASKYGCFVPLPCWLKSHFDRKVSIERIQSLQRDGYFFNGRDNAGACYPLTHSWLTSAIDQNGIRLPNEIVQELMAKSKWGDQTFTTLPAGAKNSHSGYKFAEPLVELPYLQAHGRHTCIASALANVVAFLAKTKDRGTSRQLLEDAAHSINEEGLLLGCPSNVRRKVPQKAKKILKRAGYDLISISIEEALVEESTYDRPFVAQVLGKTNYPHCVGFVGCWIVDPVEKWVLERTRENLDEICGEGGFLRLKWAKEIVEVKQATVTNKKMVDATQPAATAKVGQRATQLPQQPELHSLAHKAVENKQLDVIIFENDDDCKAVNNIQPAANSLLELLGDYTSDDGGDW